MQFKQIVGKEAVKQRLITSVKENRVSHAQLFLGTGRRGGAPAGRCLCSICIVPGNKLRG